MSEISVSTLTLADLPAGALTSAIPKDEKCSSLTDSDRGVTSPGTQPKRENESASVKIIAIILFLIYEGNEDYILYIILALLIFSD